MTLTDTGAATTGEPLWSPRTESAVPHRIDEFADLVSRRTGDSYRTYRDLWRFSVDRPGVFWSAVADYFGVTLDDRPADPLPDVTMPGTRWFPGAHINYAEHALSHDGTRTAVVAVDEDGTTREVSREALRGMVGALQQWLRGQGVGRGDRVVGYLPNGLAAVVGLLATTGLGAVWSACGPDYGAAGARARIGQLEPTVLIAADGYHWNGVAHDRTGEVAALCATLPSLRALLRVPVLACWPSSTDLSVPHGNWREVIAEPIEPAFVRVEFNDPLWVLFSSGTTGVPKGIVHSHGGVALDHLKLLGLHNDLRPGDCFFWYTTTNWMMWNMVASGLLVGATIVLYDGNPNHPGPHRLWELAARYRVTVLGVSPGYLAGSAKAGLRPGADHDLGALRILGVTGAPLPAQSYHWVRDNVGPDVQVASTSGGTDVVSGFAGSAPTTPVWPGELSAPLLGVDLQAFDAAGRPVVGQVGELVVTTPMPSMPIGFVGDPDGRRFHDAYFDVYDGVWRHGDWITVTDRGTLVISGRSDATLNRRGVRLGSADVYDVVEPLPGIREALVVGAELPGDRYWMPLFLVLADGAELDDELRTRITDEIRSQASPRHVPDDVIAVPAIPHTRTGKKLEIPVKRILQGSAVDQVVGVDTVDDRAALEYFTRFADRPA